MIENVLLTFGLLMLFRGTVFGFLSGLLCIGVWSGIQLAKDRWR